MHVTSRSANCESLTKIIEIEVKMSYYFKGQNANYLMCKRSKQTNNAT